MSYWDKTIPCTRCSASCYLFGGNAAVQYFRCRECGAEHEVDYFKKHTTVTNGDSDAERFRKALAKHKYLCTGGLP